MNNQNYQILLGIILITVYFTYFRGSEGMRRRPTQTRSSFARQQAQARKAQRKEARQARRSLARQARKARAKPGYRKRKNPRSVSKAREELRRCRESLRQVTKKKAYNDRRPAQQAQSGGGDAW